MAVRDRSGYLAEDTVAAIATALGGPISIVRISGPKAFTALQFLTGADAAKTCPAMDRAGPRTLFRAQLRDSDGSALDDALIVRFVSPESFTGEDVVELHLHGSPYIATRVLEILTTQGIRQALPGEFSFRAVRNGKLDITQAQAVADLIGAANHHAVSLALEKMGGAQNQLLQGLAESLRTLAVLAELGIDFADQDVEEVSLPRLKERLMPIFQTLSLLRDSFDRGTKIQDGIKVTFLGLPNAGKSSFFNAILGEDRSIVSEIPGTTRDVIREKITLRTQTQMVTLRLEDTAGLRASEDQIERIGVERSQKSAHEADLVLFLIDATTVLKADFEPSLLQWRAMGSPSSKTLGILTKVDLIDSTRLELLEKDLAAFDIPKWTQVSSVTGFGVSQAIQMITESCSQWTERNPGEILLTRLDQAEAVSSALDCLDRAQKVRELDLFAADIRQALHALANLIGETPADDILAQIFSDFCIGK